MQISSVFHDIHHSKVLTILKACIKYRNILFIYVNELCCGITNIKFVDTSKMKFVVSTNLKIPNEK